MRHVLAAAVFCGFVVLAIAVWRADGRRSVVGIFIAYTVCASVGVRALGVGLWPFSTWSMMTRMAPATDSIPLVVGVTSDGIEHRVDVRVWDPPGYEELTTFLYRRMPSLPPPAIDSIGSFLLERANARRALAAEGLGVRGRPSLVDLLTPATHYLHRRRWREPTDVPERPFVEVRLYWVVFETDSAPGARVSERRELMYAYPGG